MGIVSTPLPVPPRNDAERAADAEFYRRERERPRQRHTTEDHAGFLGLVLLAVAFVVGQ